MILFTKVFNRALARFDDPDIRAKSVNDPVGYEKMLLPFLINAIADFNSPSSIASRLHDYSEPSGKSEQFDGTGSSTYTLSTTPADGAVFSYSVDGVAVVGGSYDSAANSVTFPSAVASGSVCVASWYFAGAFTDDFSTSLRSDFDIAQIMDQVVNILAALTVAEWDTQEMNRALDIRNIPTDTDFKISSPANSARAKVEHHRQGALNDADRLTSQLTWQIHTTPKGGSRFGQ
jgi:hypothetical protein